jgi:hypothetical protein
MAVGSHIQVSNYPVIRIVTVSDNTINWAAKTTNGAYKNYVEAEIPPTDSTSRDVESIKTYPEMVVQSYGWVPTDQAGLRAD